MTFRLSTIAAVAFVCVAAPAFAHGSGHSGNGMNQSMNQPMSSHMTSPSTMGGNHNSTGRNNKHEDRIVATLVGLRLASLSKQLNVAIQTKNQALAVQVLNKLKALSLLDAKFGLTSKASLGNGQTIEIGVGAHGDVGITGMATGT